MATHRKDVSVRFGAPGLLETKVQAAEIPLLRVPDVRMRSEDSAIAMIASAGLVPGKRSPRPRPADGAPEVVIRTFPRRGTLVRRGTCVDYELLPGVASDATPEGHADPGEIDLLDRPGRRPAEGRA